LQLLSVDADWPRQLGVVAGKLHLNLIDERRAATAVISGWSCHVFGKFAIAIHDCHTAIG
jgi:hypothetical protein